MIKFQKIKYLLVLVIALMTVASGSFFYLIYDLRGSTQNRILASQIRFAISDLNIKIKEWILVKKYEDKNSTHPPALNLPHLKRDIEKRFGNIQKLFSSDPQQLSRVFKLERDWNQYANTNSRLSHVSFDILNKDLSQIEAHETEIIEMHTPLIDRMFKILYYGTIGLLITSSFIVVISIFVISQENKNQLRTMNFLRDAKLKAEEALKIKTKFLGIVSHEIRTPLNAIIGMSEVLLCRNPDKETQQGLKLIHGSGGTLLRIVNDILEYSKYESGGIELVQHEFSLNHLINQIMIALQDKAKSKGVSFVADVDKNLLTQYVGDYDRIVQVLLNLVFNAIKFTSVGSVVLKIKEDPKDSNKILFQVDDTGIGIGSEKQKLLFKPFVQLQKNGTSGEAGSGLGLSIAQSLVTAMGGEIKVMSTEGHGASFRFSLPLVAASNQTLSEAIEMDSDSIDSKIEPPQEVISGSNLIPLKILVAEDNSSNRIVIEAMLKKLGMNVTLVNNGQEAIDRLSKVGFDLILMDCQMPVMDGLEATQIIKKKYPFLPIIALTANAWETDERLCKETGMDLFVKKPVTIRELKKVLSIYGTYDFSKVDEHILRDLENQTNASLRHQIVNEFLSSLDEFKISAQSYIEEANELGLTHLAHKFRSSALTVGAIQFARGCEKIERETLSEALLTILKQMIHQIDDLRIHLLKTNEQLDGNDILQQSQ